MPFQITVSWEAHEALARAPPHVRNEITRHVRGLAELASITTPPKAIRLYAPPSDNFHFRYEGWAVEYEVNELHRMLTVRKVTEAVSPPSSSPAPD